MKPVISNNRILFSLTTLLVLFSSMCILSSCREDFDFDEAHAITTQEKFTNVFIKEFGKPAENHQWGFDLVDFEINGTLPTTRAYYKVENHELANYFLEKPDPITEREHKEVYAWFSSHRVTWEHTPSYSQEPRTNQIVGNVAKYVGSNKIALIDRNGKWDYGSANSTVLASNQLGSLKNYASNHAEADCSDISTDITFHNGWIQRVASNLRTEECEITLFDGENCVDFYTTGGQEYYLKTEDGNDYVRIDMQMHKMYYVRIDKGWFNYETSYYMKYSDTDWRGCDSNCNLNGKNYSSMPDGAKEVTASFLNKKSSIKHATVPLNKSAHMDYLCACDRTAETYSNHINDFNGSYNGYGYQYEGPFHLATDADLEKWTYKASVGGNTSVYSQDKYIIVYLEGDGYSGYYIGFDFESWGDINAAPDKRVKADGFCNDWIIKVSHATNGSSNFRIMCEDLGGDTGQPNASDIDYNDLVLDVNFKEVSYLSKTKNVVTLNLKAAGGTLPLTVYYDGTKLFETHELFKGVYDKRDMSESDYKEMINTYGSKSTGTLDNVETGLTAPSYILFIDPEESKGIVSSIISGIDALINGTSSWIKNNGYDKQKWGKTQNLFGGSTFDIDKLEIKVYRHGVEDYVKTKGESPADWVTIRNQHGEAPLLLCVPQSVGWLQERVKIDDAYPAFDTWVADPTKLFWNGGTIHNEVLYHGRNN